ncbi:Uncharacterised protein [Chromobacterium violaceum]|uniref:Uncharacterized protein n=1 Tax=Chromobacterium violaceum TaxID=536 RepID=A0A447T915_CHRVL|nr:Uncharacterised protein [Chromobacterium violaceum]
MQQPQAPRLAKLRYVRFANGTACYSTAGREFAGLGEWLEYLGCCALVLSLILLQLYLPE